LLHPRHSEALKALVAGTLKSADTWESAISAAGKTEGGEQAVDAKKKEEWARLIKERKLGYFALIRNIRNIAEAGIDDEAFAELLKQLQNPEQSKRAWSCRSGFLSPTRLPKVWDAATGSELKARLWFRRRRF
jgi:hypothetical protein